MADAKKDQGSALVKWVVRIVAWTVILLGIALFIRLVIVPVCKQLATQQKTVQVPTVKTSTRLSSKREVFTLNPGQGKIIVTNYRDVSWKTTGPALVRERDGAWYNPQWKQDLPGRGTPFDWQTADAIEFWVPPGYPGPVTFTVTVPAGS